MTNIQQQQQQQQPFLRNNNNNNNKWLDLLSLILHVIFWPLLKLSLFLFPHHEYDGLAPAVCTKASQQFIQYIQQQQQQQQSTTTIAAIAIADHWSTMSFAAAKQEALHSKSLLLLYLHSPLHPGSRDFGKDVLNHPDFIHNVLSQDKILPIGYSIHTAQGSQLANMLQVTKFPFLVILQPAGTSTVQVVLRAEGGYNVRQQQQEHYRWQLQRQIGIVRNSYQVMLTEQEVRRLQRQEESDLRRQQDEEFEETLRQDQERQRQIEEERQVQIKAEEEARAVELLKEEKLQQARELVQQYTTTDIDNSSTSTTTTTMIRFCLPTGAKIQQKFSTTATIASLKAFVHVYIHDHNVHMSVNNIGLSTNFPPKQSFNDDKHDHMTCEELDLVPQAVLMVQDLDA